MHTICSIVSLVPYSDISCNFLMCRHQTVTSEYSNHVPISFGVLIFLARLLPWSSYGQCMSPPMLITFSDDIRTPILAISSTISVSSMLLCPGLLSKKSGRYGFLNSKGFCLIYTAVVRQLERLPVPNSE